MTPELVVDIGRNSLYTLLLVSAPMLGAGLLIGVVVSILQAVTQVNELTLTFVPKIVGVALAVVIFLPWIIRILVNYTTNQIGMISTF
jgi:flagellar biosynthetic protein FliQ